MSKTIQVRNVPDDVHRRLVLRAAQERRSLSEMVLDYLVQIAGRPTMAEMIERLNSREPVNLSESPADLIRAVRAERDAEIEARLRSGGRE